MKLSTYCGVLFLSLTGCGNESSADKAHNADASAHASDLDSAANDLDAASEAAPTSATLGVAGGEIGSLTDDGVTLIIPEGALTKNVKITVEQAGAAPQGYEALGPVVRFSPEGTVFKKPVSITFALSKVEPDAVVYFTKLDSDEYENIGGSVSGKTITAEVSHFSGGFPSAPRRVVTMPDPPASDASAPATPDAAEPAPADSVETWGCEMGDAADPETFSCHAYVYTNLADLVDASKGGCPGTIVEACDLTDAVGGCTKTDAPAAGMTAKFTIWHFSGTEETVAATCEAPYSFVKP